MRSRVLAGLLPLQELSEMRNHLDAKGHVSREGIFMTSGQDFRSESRPEGRNFGPGCFLVIHGFKY
jgi:hypothetical protein